MHSLCAMPNETHPDGLIGISEAARTLGVSVDTLRRWDADDKLAAIRLPGGHRRYRRSDLDALLSGDAKQAS